MQLTILTKDEEFLKAIDFNFEELSSELKSSLIKYQDLNYDDTQIKEAKADRASLNKFKEAIENKRKEIKKKCLIPYEIFEEKIKKLIVLIDNPILSIDSQVKAYENKKKEEKREKIKQVYLECCKKINTLISFEEIFDERLLNASISLETAKQNLFDKVIRIENDLKAIDDLNSEFILNVKDVYLKTFDLSKAIAENTRLLKRKEELAIKKEEPAIKEKVIFVPETALKEEPKFPVILNIFATKNEMLALRDFLINTKIEYKLEA